MYGSFETDCGTSGSDFGETNFSLRKRYADTRVGELGIKTKHSTFKSSGS